MKPPKLADVLAATTLLIAAPPAFSAAAPPLVRVYVAGAPEAVTRSRDAVQDLCSRSNVAVVVRDAAGADEALLNTEHAPGLAEAYVDLRPGSPTRVVVVDGETRQDLERRTLPESSSLEIAIETVARVVCSAVESSLAARASAASHAALVPRFAHHEERRSLWDPRASLFAAAENFGAGVRGGGGAAFGLSHGRSALGPAIWVSIAGFSAASAYEQRTNALASVALIGVKVMPMLEWRTTNDVVAFFALGGGLDSTHVSPIRVPQGGASNGGSALEPIGSAMLGARLQLTPSLSALFAVNADVDLNRHRFVIMNSDGTRLPFFDPARVRPVGIAGLSYSFGGSAASSRHAASAQRE